MTHGPVGSRQHIWTFAGALHEGDANPNHLNGSNRNCACTGVFHPLPYRLPSFIGENYFCDTANPGPGFDV